MHDWGHNIRHETIRIAVRFTYKEVHTHIIM